MNDEEINFRLQPKQIEYAASRADIVFFGGAAGGGKTYASLLESLRHKDVSGFNAICFRRHLTEIKSAGGIWDESQKIYPYFGGQPNISDLSWKWQHSGAKVQFKGLEHESSKYNFQGAQICLLMFEEVTHFTAGQFWYLISRNRSTCGVKPYVRATCNPDADSWVRELIDWWIGRDGYAIPERSGVIRYFTRINDKIIWGDSRDELKELIPDLEDHDIKSFTFIESKIQDNQELLKVNPEYLGNLKAMNAVDRGRLLDGNWDIRPAAGLYFRREWFHEIEKAPAGLQEVRSWDLAATTEAENPDADLTACVKMGKCRDGKYYVLHADQFMESPHMVRQKIQAYAKRDGNKCAVTLPKDPGQAGKAQARDMISMLSGFIAKLIPRTGSKETYASPLSAQVEAGNVYIVKGQWNEAFYKNLENFPEGAHDDLVDAASDAFNTLSRSQREMKIGR